MVSGVCVCVARTVLTNKQTKITTADVEHSISQLEFKMKWNFSQKIRTSSKKPTAWKIAFERVKKKKTKKHKNYTLKQSLVYVYVVFHEA